MARSERSAVQLGIGADGLAGAFLLSPKRAIEWFEALGLEITWDWKADAVRAEDMAFTVRKIADLDVLAAMRKSVRDALAEGITQREFRRRVAADLQRMGWYGPRTVTGPNGQTATVDLSAPHRLDTIFRTNVQSAYNVGRYQEQVEEADFAPYWQYVAVLDDRTRPTHRDMSGKVYRYDDPIWRTIYPPNGFNCRCRVRTYTESQLQRKGLTVLSSTREPAVKDFPDPGFAYNPGLVNAQDAALGDVAARARQRAEDAARGSRA